MDPKAHDFSHVSILVVEDNKINQLLVKNVLKRFGFKRVDAADDGKAALETLGSNAYDVILMDIQMPGMDGYEVTRTIRSSSDKKTSNVPVIALSGDASEKEKEKARLAGMNDYVPKPYSPEQLIAAISKYVSSGTAAPSPAPEEASGMDLAFLAKFTGGDQELTIQLIEIFLQQVPEAVEKIEMLLPEKRWSEIFPVAHKVKSSIAIFGLEEIRSCVISIEEYTRDKIKLDSVPALFQQFKAGSETAVKNLRYELKKLKENNRNV